LKILGKVQIKGLLLDQ